MNLNSKNITAIFCGTIILLLLFSCLKPEQFPVEPKITYQYFCCIKDTVDKILGNKGKILNVIFSFTDGDGDIGLAQEDTFPPFDQYSQYKNNLITTLYKKKNGVFTEVKEDSALKNFRIQPLSKSTIKKGIKGDIRFERFFLNLTKTDTIKYEIYMYDRALHKSNTIYTEEIVLEYTK